MDETPKNANKQIARAAIITMAGFVLSIATNLFRTSLSASYFGAGFEYDAYNVANKIPDLIFSLVAGGALASAFIPTLTIFWEKKDRKGGWELISAVINLVTLVLIALCGVSWFFAPQIISLISPGLESSHTVLAAELLQIMLFAPIVFGISGLIMGVLNTHQKFFLTALAPTMLWTGMIIGQVFLAPSMGIHGLAWGYLLGAFLHLLIQLPGIFKLRNSAYKFTLGLNIPAVREVGQLMAPRLFGVAVVQVNNLVNVFVASYLMEGSISALNIAFGLMLMPQRVIAQAISIAALPTFSSQYAQGKLVELRSSLASSLRAIIFIAIPATMGLILLRKPIISLLFERNNFSSYDTEMVGWVLLWYSIGLVGHSLVEILSRAFYALHDTKTPVIVGSLVMGLNVLLSLTLPGMFENWGWIPVGGLALANTIATSLEMVALIILMKRRLEGIRGKFLMSGALKSAVSAFLMSLAIILWGNYALQISILFSTLIGIGLGLIVYGSCMVLLKVPEVKIIIEMVSSRLRRGKDVNNNGE